MPLTTAISAFTLKVVERVAVLGVIRTLSKVDVSRLVARRRYLSRLLKKMEEMPFLYKDMRLSAKDDYVEVQLATAIDKLNRSYGNPDLDYRSPFSKFRAGRRAIIFGEGGYGKTTLFRHLIIRCITASAKKEFLENRKLVPVFVALKTVKPSSDFPILEAIKRSDEYFSGNIGMKRLVKLAKSRRLLLFLDGYDEIPHVGGLDHARRELETLLGSFFEKRPTFFEASEHNGFYISAQACRIYLSSRREFFDYSPIAVEPTVQRWIVKGLEDRRIDLVEKIFDNYREGTVASSGLDLNAELFMQDLKRAADDELHSLSRSPLFLTVMCYVYVSGIRKNGRSDVFERGAFDLIGDCIKLLISDLDRAKTLGFTESEASALMNRRASYPDEKISFLKYFSGLLYERSIATFDKQTLVESALQFFRGEDATEAADAIIKGLKTEDPSLNIIDQIILSGIFILVDRVQRVNFYDFPHRRFRETLAVSRYNNLVGAKVLASKVLDPAYGELILVYVEQSAFSDYMMDCLIGKLASDASGGATARLLSSAIGRVSEIQAEGYFRRIMDKAEQQGGIRLDADLLRFSPRNPDYARVVKHATEKHLRQGNALGMALWLEVAAQFEGGELQRELWCTFSKAGFRELRVFVYSSLSSIDRVGERLIEAYLKRAVECDSLEQALFDINYVGYVGKRDIDKRNFLTALGRIRDRLRAEEDELSVGVGSRLNLFLGQMEDNDVFIQDAERYEPPPPSPWRATRTL